LGLLGFVAADLVGLLPLAFAALPVGLLLVLVPVRWWRARRGQLEFGLLRHPLRREHRPYMLQAGNHWLFWGLFGAIAIATPTFTLLTGPLGLRLSPGEHRAFTVLLVVAAVHNGRSFSGDPRQLTSYLAFGQPVLAPGDGIEGVGLFCTCRSRTGQNSALPLSRDCGPIRCCCAMSCLFAAGSRPRPFRQTLAATIASAGSAADQPNHPCSGSWHLRLSHRREPARRADSCPDLSRVPGHLTCLGRASRVPLAGGLLSGAYTTSTTFAENDHLNFNRAGQSFDVGETFSGVDYEAGVRASQEFADLVAKLPFEVTPAQAALAWVAQQPGVTTVIPGARTVAQAKANAAAGELPPLDADFMAGVQELYDRELRAQIHDRW
jgi:hypothetical protein